MSVRNPVCSYKLSDEELRDLVEDLRRRHELMKELARVSMKGLAARYGLHITSVRRLDLKINDYHRNGPWEPGYMANAAKELSR